jgi:hypothetical protein
VIVKLTVGIMTSRSLREKFAPLSEDNSGTRR